MSAILCTCAFIGYLPEDGIGEPPFKYKAKCLRGRAIKDRKAKGTPLV